MNGGAFSTWSFIRLEPTVTSGSSLLVCNLRISFLGGKRGGSRSPCGVTVGELHPDFSMVSAGTSNEVHSEASTISLEWEVVKISGKSVSADSLQGEDTEGCVADVASISISEVPSGACPIGLDGESFGGDSSIPELSLFRKFLVDKVTGLGSKFLGG